MPIVTLPFSGERKRFQLTFEYDPRDGLPPLKFAARQLPNKSRASELRFETIELSSRTSGPTIYAASWDEAMPLIRSRLSCVFGIREICAKNAKEAKYPQK